jgi:hypothetical protein
MARQPVNGNSEATSVEVAGRTVNVSRSLGEINFDNLQREIADAGGSAVWWGVLHAQATAGVGRAKQQRDVTKSTVARNIRRERTRIGEKVTDASVAEEVTLDETVRDAEHAIIDAEERANILRAVAFACSEKQRTLTALSETRREINAGDGLRGPRVEDRRGR